MSRHSISSVSLEGGRITGADRSRKHYFNRTRRFDPKIFISSVVTDEDLLLS